MKQHEFSKPKGKASVWTTSNHYILPDGTKTTSKPESMTQLIGDKLVYKDDPRIILRGKLDSFQAELLCVMRLSLTMSPSLTTQLKELLAYSREILGCEVLNTPLKTTKLLGLTFDEIREHSHYPHKFFELEQMILLDETYNEIVLALNALRAKVREIEIAVVQAFRVENNLTREDLVQALNRMSSCFHILMYQEISKHQSNH